MRPVGRRTTDEYGRPDSGDSGVRNLAVHRHKEGLSYAVLFTREVHIYGNRLGAAD